MAFYAAGQRLLVPEPAAAPEGVLAKLTMALDEGADWDWASHRQLAASAMRDAIRVGC